MHGEGTVNHRKVAGGRKNKLYTIFIEPVLPSQYIISLSYHGVRVTPKKVLIERCCFLSNTIEPDGRPPRGPDGRPPRGRKGKEL